ncbi:MAG: M28 family peptidase [Bacteroidota bacterium]
MRIIVLSAFLLSATMGIAQKADPATYAKTITMGDLKKHLTIVAGPEMEGRETGTEGERKAAAYLEAEYKRMGLKPGNGNSYQATFSLFQLELTSSKLSVNGLNFTADKDYAVSVSMIANGTATYTDVVFAGYGISDSTRNDYANLNVKGKIVMVLEGTPGSTAAVNPRGAASIFGKLGVARTKGAVGVLVVSKSFPKTTPGQTKGGLSLTKPTTEPAVAITISEQIASALLGRTSALTIQQMGELNKGIYRSELKITADKKVNEIESRNVIAVLPGTDKADEYVFVTSHFDHEGIRNGAIYYGADDDGSGTVSVLEVAEAFATAKKKGNGPRRTMVFMNVSGEEKGLLGSRYYSEHPIFPLDKTSVDLNIDMVGRIDPTYKGDSMNYVYIIGDDKLSSDLTPITNEVNTKYSNMELDRRFNDPKDPNRFYYRSDHFNFAAKGVPVIFYFNGTHRDYHRPTDTVDKINFDVMEKRVRLIYHTAWVIANRDTMLKRDIPLNMPPR